MAFLSLHIYNPKKSSFSCYFFHLYFFLYNPMATPTSNNRASLLAGLRTGGVRSSSVAVPHTAAPNGAFAISRFPSQQHNPIFQEDDEYLDFHPRNVPMTAAVDGPNNRFAGHQAINPASPYAQQYNSSASAQAQIQMQMLQLEMMRIQVRTPLVSSHPPLISLFRLSRTSSTSSPRPRCSSKCSSSSSSKPTVAKGMSAPALSPIHLPPPVQQPPRLTRERHPCAGQIKQTSLGHNLVFVPWTASL